MAVRQTSIFISFNHNERDISISGWMEEALNGTRFARGLRIISSPLYGLRFDEEIRRRVSEVDGVITLWSPEGASSFWVSYELYIASELKRPILLIEYDSEPLPQWWNPSRHNVRLYGMAHLLPSLPLFSGALLDDGAVRKPVMDASIHFARQVRDGDGRLISVPKPDPRLYKNSPPDLDSEASQTA